VLIQARFNANVGADAELALQISNTLTQALLEYKAESLALMVSHQFFL